MHAILFSLALAAPHPVAGQNAPKLELAGEVRKIWDAGKHNAFTDLIRFKDRWYCTFREADGHVGGDGQLRVLSSADGARWEWYVKTGDADQLTNQIQGEDASTMCCG